MLSWTVKKTDTFLAFLKKHKHNTELFNQLDKKIQRLQEDPFVIGGLLAGPLAGKRSTRLLKNFRLIFSIEEDQKIVYLEALDHRKDVYR